MLGFLIKLFGDDDSESGYFVAAEDEDTAYLNARHHHDENTDLHECSTEIKDSSIEVREEELKDGNWLSWW